MSILKLKQGLLLICLLLVAFVSPAGNFKSDQRKMKRVRDAYLEKEALMDELLKKAMISKPFKVFIRILKREASVEVFAADESSGRYELLKRFPVCFSSGVAGPKRHQGDLQVPEGVYHINRFNPQSSYHLSLGINYPNDLDRRVASGSDPGGDIFIHGSCVSIGCIPIEDDNIKLLYILCVEARDAGQKQIPVHIFPCRMDDQGMQWLRQQEPSFSDFWRTLQPIYEYFEASATLPEIIMIRNHYEIRNQ